MFSEEDKIVLRRIVREEVRREINSTLGSIMLGALFVIGLMWMFS